MESANEKITSSPSSSPLPSSSDHLQAAPESKGIGNSDPRLNQTDTGAGEIASAGKGLSPKTPASTSGPLEVDVGNVVATSENGLATTPSPAGSLLSTSYIDEDFQGGSTPKTEQLNGELSQGNDSATQSPPKQVMERPSEPSTPYRIPDYVFARKPSTAPMEWSAASNESLFSIQMGNMSFTREQFAFLGKSGELGLSGEQNMLSGPYIDFSSNQPPDKQVEFSQNGGNLDEGPNPRVTEAKAVETMREVIREIAENDNKASPSSSADNHSKGSPSPSVRNPIVSPSLTEHKFHNISSLSHASDGSTKSFAFPVLAGEERSGSLRVDGVGKQKQHSPRRGSRPQTPKESRKPIAASQSPKSALTPIKHKWLPCSCCPFCN
ncbi:hypothetical protein RchiOBHm_Chr7g0183151 [Rosa chinensis]|uniref:Uncharacterized protein n=1 Tax=Rosa chinensis TaxID=74649 RepID=A0A2P6P343_ROSCH|nr:uncharacterized protein LOC112176434 [Rosa chinensis]XP_040367970.1 uncharacterized protein LOC112176434 [Rosa chinensis]PRQ16339.1 hypothetical protein RchiOBHm_Chr7g0183151 [Rosa chinensis]